MAINPDKLQQLVAQAQSSDQEAASQAKEELEEAGYAADGTPKLGGLGSVGFTPHGEEADNESAVDTSSKTLQDTVRQATSAAPVDKDASNAAKSLTAGYSYQPGTEFSPVVPPTPPEQKSTTTAPSGNLTAGGTLSDMVAAAPAAAPATDPVKVAAEKAMSVPSAVSGLGPAQYDTSKHDEAMRASGEAIKTLQNTRFQPPDNAKYHQIVDDIYKQFQAEKGDVKTMQGIEAVANALGRLGAGMWGLKTGVDMSGAKFDVHDWKEELHSLQEELHTRLEQAGKGHEIDVHAGEMQNKFNLEKAGKGVEAAHANVTATGQDVANQIRGREVDVQTAHDIDEKRSRDDMLAFDRHKLAQENDHFDKQYAHVLAAEDRKSIEDLQRESDAASTQFGKTMDDFKTKSSPATLGAVSGALSQMGHAHGVPDKEISDQLTAARTGGLTGKQDYADWTGPWTSTVIANFSKIANDWGSRTPPGIAAIRDKVSKQQGATTAAPAATSPTASSSPAGLRPPRPGMKWVPVQGGGYTEVRADAVAGQ